MTHPAIDNLTPFAFEPLFLAEEEGRPLFVPIVKATYVIRDGGALELAEEQVAVNMAGEPLGDPETSSYKYEPETAFVKPATDVVLIGHAHAPKPGTTALQAGLRVGSLQKVIAVVGDRFWVRAAGGVSMTKPKPFERIPLIFEKAFGGWDRSDPDPDKHTLEPRNPVGTGFRVRWGKDEQAIALPNLEDPKRPIKSLRDRPRPVGFGFTSPNWQPRAGFAGTYDEAWMKSRMPLLPTDFDRRFFNAAPADQIARGYLHGNEAVAILNASVKERLGFDLPGVPPPRTRVELRGRRDETLETALDTVIINTDENLVFLIWRANLVVRNGPQDVVSIMVEAGGVAQRAANP